MIGFKNYLILEETFHYQPNVTPEEAPHTKGEKKFKFKIGDVSYSIHTAIYTRNEYGHIFPNKKVMLFAFDTKQEKPEDHRPDNTDNVKVMATISNYMVKMAKDNDPDVIIFHSRHELPDVRKTSNETYRGRDKMISNLDILGYHKYRLPITRSSLAYVLSKEPLTDKQVDDAGSRMEIPKTDY